MYSVLIALRLREFRTHKNVSQRRVLLAPLNKPIPRFLSFSASVKLTKMISINLKIALVLEVLMKNLICVWRNVYSIPRTCATVRTRVIVHSLLFKIRKGSKCSFTLVHDLKKERLSPSHAIYNGSIDFRLAYVLPKTSLA